MPLHRTFNYNSFKLKYLRLMERSSSSPQQQDADIAEEESIAYQRTSKVYCT